MDTHIIHNKEIDDIGGDHLFIYIIVLMIYNDRI